MQRYFAKKIINQKVTLDMGDIHHITNVMRNKINDKMEVVYENKVFLCNIENIGINNVELSIIKEEEGSSRNFQIIIAVSLVKEQKMDLILQKATELGVWSFQPFICQRSIREKPSPAKKERWMKIIQEATRQSERLWLAQINDVIDFSDLIKRDFGLKLAASIEGQKIMDIPKAHVNRILLLIGPEGDFSAEEYEKLKAENFSLLKLSENILRVETASIIASGLITYFFA
jgi:16S rRNA (uracil1498-N3)-methyltransferase